MRTILSLGTVASVLFGMLVVLSMPYTLADWQYWLLVAPVIFAVSVFLGWLGAR